MTFIRPSDDVLESTYWEGLRRGDLLLQRCAECDQYRHPPTPICSRCRSFGFEWVVSSGVGMLNTYTVVHHAVHPLLEAWVPYNIALVELEEGPMLVSSVRGIEVEELVVGAPLICEIEEVAPGFSLPYFRRHG